MPKAIFTAMLGFRLRGRRLALFVSTLLAWSSPALAAIEIDESDQNFEIVSGSYQWTISKTRFSVIERASDDGRLKLEGGEASADFLGGTSIFGPPSEFLEGPDWVELRGWADESKNLWYVARYRFFDSQPYLHLALSLMDRHENFETDKPSDPYWRDRMLSNYKVSLHTAEPLDVSYFRQTSSFTGHQVGVDPEVVVRANEGRPFKWRRISNGPDIELVHGMTENPDRAAGRINSVTWIPNYTGRARLIATLTPGRHRPGEDVLYIVQHQDGVENLVLDQDSAEIDLGAYNLNRDSAVSLFTESSSDVEGDVRAKSLRVETERDGDFEVGFTRLPDDVLEVGDYVLGVVDLWQNWPIDVYSSERSLNVTAITEPSNWSGGIGYTLDLAVVIDSAKGADAMAAITSPPPDPTLPSWWSPFDGTLAPHDDYDGLVARAAESIRAADERVDNYGWRGFGDYQIGLDLARDGRRLVNSGGLQYDLATGLLLAWMRTGDSWFWRRARAAIRHQMDVSMAKFYPFAPKRSGHLRRKGKCDLLREGSCQEPIPAFGYGYRGFLLWHHLTGEAWAKDLAYQNIDAHAFFSARSGGTHRSITDWLLHKGDRAGAWIMRGLFTGAHVFPDGTQSFENADGIHLPNGTGYGTVLREQLSAMLPIINQKVGHYPSAQPVWAGQGLEALSMAYLTPDSPFRSPELREAVLKTCEDLANSVRWSGGAYEYVYFRKDGEVRWSSEANYGWLWLSGLAACAKIDGTDKFRTLADDLFDYMISYFQAEPNITIREWSVILAFGGYYLERQARR